MRPKISDRKWDRILQDAFSSGAPDPQFSEQYRARRQRMERKLAMKEERKELFRPGLVLATVGALLIAAVPVGLIVMMNRSASQGLDPGAAVTEEIKVSETAAEVSETIPEIAGSISKDDLFRRTMNTLVYLDKISGDVTIRNGCNFPLITSGHFAHDFTNGVYQTKADFAQADDPSVMIQENQYFANGSHVDAFYYYSNTNISNIYHAEDFENASSNDPTCGHELAACFLPQEMAAGYLENIDNWDIVGTDEINHRKCAIVEGKSQEYGSKFGVSTFRITIDEETGVWVQYEGFDEAGELQDYMYTQNLRFSDEAESPSILTSEEIERMIAEGNYIREEFAILPDVTGYQYDYARKILEQLGFELSLVYECNDDFVEGSVIRMEPAPDDAQPVGSTVTVYVAQNAETTEENGYATEYTNSFEMPDLWGMQEEQAKTLLMYFGADVEIIYEPSDRYTGTVIAQSIAPGEVAEWNSKVTLTIAAEN